LLGVQKEFRIILGVAPGDRIKYEVEDGNVYIIKSETDGYKINAGYQVKLPPHIRQLFPYKSTSSIKIIGSEENKGFLGQVKLYSHKRKNDNEVKPVNIESFIEGRYSKTEVIENLTRCIEKIKASNSSSFETMIIIKSVSITHENNLGHKFKLTARTANKQKFTASIESHSADIQIAAEEAKSLYPECEIISVVPEMSF